MKFYKSPVVGVGTQDDPLRPVDELTVGQEWFGYDLQPAERGFIVGLKGAVPEPLPAGVVEMPRAALAQLFAGKGHVRFGSEVFSNE